MRDEHAINVLDEDALIVVLLEGQDFGPDRIVPSRWPF